MVGVFPHRRDGTRSTCSVHIALLRRQYEKPINVSARIEACETARL